MIKSRETPETSLCSSSSPPSGSSLIPMMQIRQVRENLSDLTRDELLQGMSGGFTFQETLSPIISAHNTPSPSNFLRLPPYS